MAAVVVEVGVGVTGPITIDCDVLTAPGTDLRIVMYTATPGTEDASKLALLNVTGLRTLA